jgi:gamma-glutamyltranspeptidase/glutathione hydrolase
MRLRKVLQAAIQYCEEGFPVAELAAEAWRESEALLKNDEGGSANYLPNGRPPRAGEIFKNPRMAKTLRRIADEGPDVFYQGDIAEKIVRCSNKKGGLFTLKDFPDHRSDWVEPVSANYRGYDIHELPPATHGFVTLEMLKILEGFDLKAMDPQSADALHLMIEAKKLAFADRDRWLADRDHMKVSVKDLFSPERVKALRANIQMDRAAGESPSVSPPQRGRIKEGVPVPIRSTSQPRTVKAISFLLSKATLRVLAPASSSRKPGSSYRIVAICFQWKKMIPTASDRTSGAFTHSCPE